MESDIQLETYALLTLLFKDPRGASVPEKLEAKLRFSVRFGEAIIIDFHQVSHSFH